MERILLIDDDNDYRGMLKTSLERAGFEVWEATDGDQGIDLYRKNGFSIVLSDLFMPQIDGVQTVFKLRQEFPHCKIITITGANVSEGRAQHLFGLAKQCGANEVHRKSSHFNELLIKIRSLI